MNIIDENYTGIRELEWMESAYNYNRWIIKLCAAHIGLKILEIGSGIGTFTREWSKRADKVIAVEPSANCVSILKKRFLNNPKIEIWPMSILDLNPFADGLFDTVIGLNVFEHIENDVSGFEIISKALRPGGKLVLFVPACQKLYGNIDKKVGHFRRYEKKELIAKLNAAGMKINSIFFVNSIGYIAWLWKTKKSKLSSPEDYITSKNVLLYDRLFIPVLRIFEEWVRPPIGQSLFVVAEKPDKYR